MRRAAPFRFARLGEAVARATLFSFSHRCVDVGRIETDQRRRKVRIDGQLDAFGTFFTVGQAADSRGFANTLDAIARTQADDDQGLLLHRRHGKLMRANGRKVYQNRFDGGDLGVHT